MLEFILDFVAQMLKLVNRLALGLSLSEVLDVYALRLLFDGQFLQISLRALLYACLPCAFLRVARFKPV